jgi:endoglucanase
LHRIRRCLSATPRQSANTFDVLKVPEDKNIILSFHFYEPFLLTHYHASWTGLRNYTGPVHYPGALISKAEFDMLDSDRQEIAKDYVDKEWSIETIEQMMQLPIEKGTQLGLQVYCGEYGVIDGSPEEDKIRWYNDMISVFNKNGIASANWNYKSGSFGLVSKEMEKNAPVVESVVKR